MGCDMRRASSCNAHTASSFYKFLSDRVLLTVAAVAFWSSAVEGPLRFLLHSVSAETLIYLRDLLGLGALVCVVLSWATGQREAAPPVVALAILLGHTLIGVLQLPSAFQALFGFKIFLPFLVGLMVAPLLRVRDQLLFKTACAAFWISAVGVFANVFFEYPWIGLDYETAFGTTQVSRQWWVTGGIMRLPGFARASYSAAAIMLVSAVPALLNRGATLHKSAVVIAGTGAIVLTTSKAPLIGFVVLLADALLVYRLRLRALYQGVPPVLAALGVVMPLIAVQLNLANLQVPEILLSFMQRVSEMWPGAFALFSGPGEVVWGRGLGGIGTAQGFGGEWQLSNSADNVMVYLLVSLGLAALVYMGLLVLRVFSRLQVTAGSPANQDRYATWVRSWFVVWLANGLTSNMIEEPVSNMVLGLLVGFAFAPRPEPSRFAAGGEISALGLGPASQGLYQP